MRSSRYALSFILATLLLCDVDRLQACSPLNASDCTVLVPPVLYYYTGPDGIGVKSCSTIGTTSAPWIANIAVSQGPPNNVLTFDITSQNTGLFGRWAVISMQCDQVLVMQCARQNCGFGCQVNWSLAGHFHQWDSPPLVDPYFGFLPIPNPPPNQLHPFVLCPTIKSGCALTTAATMLSSFPALSAITPVELDAALIRAGNSGYGKGCLGGAGNCDPQTAALPDACEMNWEFIGWMSPTISMIDSQDTAGATLVKNGLPITIDDYLTEHVCTNGDRVILKLNEIDVLSGFQVRTGVHYVMVTGRAATPIGSNMDWAVFDPGWNPANIDPNTVVNFSTLNGHELGFITNSASSPFVLRQFSVAGVRTYRDISSVLGTTGAGPRGLGVVANSPVEILLTDPQGRRLGHDTSGDLFEIPNGSYFRDDPVANDEGTDIANGDPTAIKNAYVPAPLVGSYRLTLAGTGLGTYTLRVGSRATDGSTQTTTIEGVSGAGSSSAFQIQFASAPGLVPDIVRTATFQSTLDDVNNSLRLDLIKGSRLADRLSDKIERAAEESAGGEISAARHSLKEFKKEVNAETPSNVKEVAARVLLEDADSLFMQLPKPKDDDDDRSNIH